MDTGFTNGELDIKAYVSRGMSLGTLQLGTDFLEVELDLRTTDVQKISGVPAWLPPLPRRSPSSAHDAGWPLQVMCWAHQTARARQPTPPSTASRLL